MLKVNCIFCNNDKHCLNDKVPDRVISGMNAGRPTCMEYVQFGETCKLKVRDTHPGLLPSDSKAHTHRYDIHIHLDDE